MKTTCLNCKRLIPGLILMVGLWASAAGTASAQDPAAGRQIRAYVPPDQLVSFLPSTPFDRFLDFLNPIFQRVTGKTVIDPDNRTHPIGVSVSGMHFLDALEQVLGFNDLIYRETERYFMIEVRRNDGLILDGEEAANTAGGLQGGVESAPADLSTRQIRINAILFEINHNVSRDIGLNWSVITGSGSGGGQGGGGGGGGGGGAGASNQAAINVEVDTYDVFGDTSPVILPETIGLADINQFFRFAEINGAGEAIATPNVTVQSGVEGSIQIGSDVPVQVRDFAGNAVTQFFKTGIIVDVTPTLITEAVADTLGSPEVEFIHLNVKVEKSGSRPSLAGIIIDRSTATTQVLLLPGEQTIIGGLYSTDESSSRSGIPVLKDLPGWFFGLRYLFGREQLQKTQKELIIVLQAELIDPILARQGRTNDNLLRNHQNAVQRFLNQFDAEVGARVPPPRAFQGEGKN